jgi:hypothetical protein
LKFEKEVHRSTGVYPIVKMTACLKMAIGKKRIVNERIFPYTVG